MRASPHCKAHFRTASRRLTEPWPTIILRMREVCCGCWRCVVLRGAVHSPSRAASTAYQLPTGLSPAPRAMARDGNRAWSARCSRPSSTVPRPRRALVPRPRLRERLDRGAEAKLTLVAAPAGFGKTTLLAEWLAAAPADARSAAWLSLDQGDNQPTSFWTYLIAALQTAAPGVGAGALALLAVAAAAADRGGPRRAAQRARRAPARRRAGARRLPRHRRRATSTSGLAFLLDHLPPTLHLVIASRADPPLPLARLRARGELVELRAADLRFTPEEAATFLNEAMGLALAAADVAALEDAHRGLDRRRCNWRRCRCRGAPTRPGSSRAFAGDDRYVAGLPGGRGAGAPARSRSAASCCTPPCSTG